MTLPREPLVAFAVFLAAVASRRRLGPHADWTETLRAHALPPLDPLLQRWFGGPGSAYQLGPAEFVTTVDVAPETVERRLWSSGCRRNLLAAAKTLSSGEHEIGSWAYRGSSIPPHRQVHIMLFQRDDGGTDIYAHYEFSSALWWVWRNPTVLYNHYHGVGYSPQKGEAFVRDHILPAIQ